jgi:hypothetical protein
MRIVGQFVAVLLVVGFIGAYFWWIFTIVAAFALAWGAQRAFREISEMEAAEARRQAAMVKRANQQHRWTMKGDPRGTFGRYPPANV